MYALVRVRAKRLGAMCVGQACSQSVNASAGHTREYMSAHAKPFQSEKAPPYDTEAVAFSAGVLFVKNRYWFAYITAKTRAVPEFRS